MHLNGNFHLQQLASCDSPRFRMPLVNWLIFWTSCSNWRLFSSTIKKMRIDLGFISNTYFIHELKLWNTGTSYTMFLDNSLYVLYYCFEWRQHVNELWHAVDVPWRIGWAPVSPSPSLFSKKSTKTRLVSFEIRHKICGSLYIPGCVLSVSTVDVC